MHEQKKQPGYTPLEKRLMQKSAELRAQRASTR